MSMADQLGGGQAVCTSCAAECKGCTKVRQVWALGVIDRAQSALLRARTKAELLQGVCDAATADGVVALAWAGIPEYNEDRTVSVAARSGAGIDYLTDIAIEWGEDSVLGAGPTGTALRTGKVQCFNNIVDNPNFAPWCENAKKYNLMSSLAIPVVSSTGKVLVGFMIYSSMCDAFGEAELALFTRLAEDIAYGIEHISTKAAHEKVIFDVIESMAHLAELRDLYTASHQHRVSVLAAAIAAEMELSNFVIEGIRIAAQVHDIGKIGIPAELLVKPAKLTPIEYELIKGHDTAGYEALKQIDFPWPIAEAVYQHHERLNGTGYPRGLVGDDIILEARIIAVADVVESMTSHRPYRPALGCDVAIAELDCLVADGQVDPDVVTACKTVLATGILERLQR